MSEKDFPEINKMYSGFVIAIGLAAASFFLWGAYSHPDIGVSVIFLFLSALCAISPAYIVHQAGKVKINKSGISSGATHFAWKEVTNVKTVQFGIHIYSGSKKIIVGPYHYKKPDLVISSIAEGVNNAT
jgi:hypothetical protein